MATGYTGCIKDGSITFKQFALRCSRAFGALVTMRDDPMSDEIPDEIKPTNTYYEEKLKEQKAYLEELESMSDVEANQQARLEFDERQNYNKTRIAEIKDLEAKYKKMADEVSAWKPPTNDHLGLKSFMLEQLYTSLDFDCSPRLIDMYEEALDVQVKPGKEWKQDEIVKCMKDIAYYTEKHAKEIERCNKATNWIQALKKSL